METTRIQCFCQLWEGQYLEQPEKEAGFFCFCFFFQIRVGVEGAREQLTS